MNRSVVAGLADGATGSGRRDADATLMAVLDAIEEALAGRRDITPAGLRRLRRGTPPCKPAAPGTRRGSCRTERRARAGDSPIIPSTEIVRIRAALGYTLSSGLIFAPFIAYLSSAQQIFQQAYDTGVLFPAYFASLALAIGIALLVNRRLVMRHGMRMLCKVASTLVAAVSLAMWAGAVAFDGLPPLWLFMAYLAGVFMCVGVLFGNLTALAMTPLGHIAGVGAAVVASLGTLVSVPLGMLIGQRFDGTMYALIGGFALFGAATRAALRFAESGRGAPDVR